MPTTNIKEGDWIERNIPPESVNSRWAKVTKVHGDSSIMVLYLDGATVVSGKMILKNGWWAFAQSGPSGRSIRENSRHLEKELKAGPPFHLDTKANSIVYRQSPNTVWRIPIRRDEKLM